MIEEDRQALLLFHRDTLGRFVRRLTPSMEDAEDLKQDLAIVVLAHHTGPPDAESFAAWCCGVARNLAAHRRRSEARRRRKTEDSSRASDTDCAANDPETCAIARESLAMKLDGLNSTALALLRDRFVLEETAEEIGTRLNVSSASVRMRIARILAVLRIVEDESTEDMSLSG